MRIIAGICKGKNLKSLPGSETRPTSNKVKGSIFDVLSNNIKDKKMLDLFGGTGSVGIEALSRGCSQVTFVEKNQQAMKIIKENVAKCGFTDQASYYNLDAFKAIQLLGKKKTSFDLVYLDPPYNFENTEILLESLLKSEILEALAIVVFESYKKSVLIEKIENLEKIKEKTYGDTKITYYQLM